MSGYEESSKSLVVIGFGKMGSSWARAFCNQGASLDVVIDPNPVEQDELEKYEASLYSDISYVQEDISDSIWCIATPVQNHSEYLREAVNRNIKNILVEKPVADSPKAVENIDFSGSNVSVDFIELEHPVVREILDDISKTDFGLGNAIHWRGKKSSKIHAYMRDDIVHDVSELFALYDVLGYDRSSLEIVDVTDVESWVGTGRFKKEEMREEYDSSGIVFFRGFNNEPICMTGGFNQEHQRRYFLWVNEENNLAYFGSTVTRNHLTPVACRIRGSKNIGYAIQRCLSGTLRNNEEISNFILETEATKLESGSKLDNGMSRREQIASKILRGEVSPADIKIGIEIDNLIYQIYQNQETVDPY